MKIPPIIHPYNTRSKISSKSNPTSSVVNVEDDSVSVSTEPLILPKPTPAKKKKVINKIKNDEQKDDDYVVIELDLPEFSSKRSKKKNSHGQANENALAAFFNQIIMQKLLDSKKPKKKKSSLIHDSDSVIVNDISDSDSLIIHNKKPTIEIIESDDETPFIKKSKKKKNKKSKNKTIDISEDNSNKTENIQEDNTDDNTDDNVEDKVEDKVEDNEENDDESYVKSNEDSEEDSDEDSEDSDYKDEDDWSEITGLPEEVNYITEEHKYFRKLPEEEQQKIIELEKSIIEVKQMAVPIRFQILNSSLSQRSKINIIDRIDHYYDLSPNDNEYSKLGNWVNMLSKVPFQNIVKQPVSITDSPSIIRDYILKVHETLNQAVFGHLDAKAKIIEIIVQNITNPSATGNCIAIQGPMGNGKTTLIKEGVCKAIGRPFAFIALGGAQGSEFLTGHDYTYEGSKPGRIVEMLTECGCMNPVIYFDELDKVSTTPKGEEIYNLLVHLTDPSQNKEFHDKYFAGVDFDLSKALFIFSYNDSEKINPILLDRIIKIKTDGFNAKDKLVIAQNYLLRSIFKEYNMNADDIIFPKEVIELIIREYTDNENGVRNLRRCLDSIISKINVIRLLSFSTSESIIESQKESLVEVVKEPIEETNGISLVISKKETIIESKPIDFKKILGIKFNKSSLEFPYTVSVEDVRSMLKIKETDVSIKGMYM